MCIDNSTATARPPIRMDGGLVMNTLMPGMGDTWGAIRATTSAAELRSPSGLSDDIDQAALFAPAPLAHPPAPSTPDIGIGAKMWPPAGYSHHLLIGGAVGRLDLGLQPAGVVAGQEILRHDHNSRRWPRCWRRTRPG